MTIRISIFGLAILCISQAASANDTPSISHGPVLGAVSEHTAKIWVRTTLPADVTSDLFEVGTAVQLTQNSQTTLASDNTCIITFKGCALTVYIPIGRGYPSYL